METAALIHEKESDAKYILDYLKERMCHPDRKYWKVNSKPQDRAVRFVQNIRGLVIPDLTELQKGIARIAARKVFKGG